MNIMITNYTVPLNFIESQNNLDKKKRRGRINPESFILIKHGTAYSILMCIASCGSPEWFLDI